MSSLQRIEMDHHRSSESRVGRHGEPRNKACGDRVLTEERELAARLEDGSVGVEELEHVSSGRHRWNVVQDDGVGRNERVVVQEGRDGRRSPEIRMPKAERNPKSEPPKSAVLPWVLEKTLSQLRISDVALRISFVLRPSSFAFRPS